MQCLILKERHAMLSPPQKKKTLETQSLIIGSAAQLNIDL